MDALSFYKFLGLVHQIVGTKRYLEVGVRLGNSLSVVPRDCRCVGVDPEYKIMFPPPEVTKLFRTTSDDFFDKYNPLEELGGPVEVALIDGMHLFEFALRDFINIETYCDKSSFILIDDCLPYDAVRASRDRTTGFWMGDVWKLVPCLKKYRPDLQVLTLGCPPCGLSIISNLDPGSSTLIDNYDEIEEEFIGMDFSTISTQKARALNVVPCNEDMVRAILTKDDMAVSEWRSEFLARVDRNEVITDVLIGGVGVPVRPPEGL